MERAQRVDEKNEVICTPRVLVIKMLKWLILCDFCR